MAADTVTLRDIRRDIEHNCSIQEGILSTMQNVVLKLERKLSHIEVEVQKLRTEIQTLSVKTEQNPNWTNVSSGRGSSNSGCTASSAMLDEQLNSFRELLGQMKQELRAREGTKEVMQEGCHREVAHVAKEDAALDQLVEKTRGENQQFLHRVVELVREDNRHFVYEVIRQVHERVESFSVSVLSSLNEQMTVGQNHVQTFVTGKQEEVLSFLCGSHQDIKAVLQNNLDDLREVRRFRHEVTMTLDGIKHESSIMREFRENFSENLENYIQGRTREDNSPRSADGTQLVGRLTELNDQIQQLPNINQVMLELIATFREIRELTEESSLLHEDTELQSEVSQGGSGRYKTRRHFRSDQAYADYVTAHVTPGMRVTYLQHDDPEVGHGDTGVVEEVDVGHVTVTWRRAGRVGVPCEEVHIER